jgi:hypothetical protein
MGPGFAYAEFWPQSELRHAPALRAPEIPFALLLWTDAKVHPDHHIQVARALYSVPTRYLRKQVRARADKLRLCDKYGIGHVEAVCQSALAFDSRSGEG